ANSTDATTARCGGRREAEKIGRSWVADNTDSGTDHSGLPAGNDLAVSRLELAFGLAIGITRPISTLSGASTARSVEMTSSVEEVAAGTCGEKTTNTPPDSKARRIILHHPAIFRPVATTCSFNSLDPA